MIGDLDIILMVLDTITGDKSLLLTAITIGSTPVMVQIDHSTIIRGEGKLIRQLFNKD